MLINVNVKDESIDTKQISTPLEQQHKHIFEKMECILDDKIEVELFYTLTHSKYKSSHSRCSIS